MAFEKTIEALKKLETNHLIDTGDIVKATRELTIIDALFWPLIADLKTENPAVVAPVMIRMLDKIG